MKVRIEIRPADFEGNAWYRHGMKVGKKGTTDDRRRTTDFILFMVYKMQFPKMQQTWPESLSSVVRRLSSSSDNLCNLPIPCIHTKQQTQL